MSARGGLVVHAFRVSVNRRLVSLVVAEVLAAGALLVLFSGALAKTIEELAFDQRFVLAPVEALADILGQQASLLELADKAEVTRTREDWLALAPLHDAVGRFLVRYRAEWEVAESDGADAVRMRAELGAIAGSDLIERELIALRRSEELSEKLQAGCRAAAEGREPGEELVGEARELRVWLRELLRVNLAFASVSHGSIRTSLERSARIMTATGLGGIVLAALLGLWVRWAIAPRIDHLVEAVTRFRESGEHERIGDPGSDEISVLATALDAGFSSIAAREKERERFLAVVAHELKTPITSLVGFAQVALAHPEQGALRDRALTVVRKQTRRLTRLIDEIIWTARSRGDELGFHPTATELAGLLRRNVAELEEELPDRKLELRAPEAVHVLADERLLGHALRTLLEYAWAVSTPEAAIPVVLEANRVRVLVRIGLVGSAVPAIEVEQAFSPFGTVLFEDRRVRSAIGLSFARHVVRLHGGTMRVREDAAGAWVELEVPA